MDIMAVMQNNSDPSIADANATATDQSQRSEPPAVPSILLPCYPAVGSVLFAYPLCIVLADVLKV